MYQVISVLIIVMNTYFDYDLHIFFSCFIFVFEWGYVLGTILFVAWVPWYCMRSMSGCLIILLFYEIYKLLVRLVYHPVRNHLWSSYGSKYLWIWRGVYIVHARRPEDIYHVTVMPCYDKKLEAARDDFVFQADSDAESITEVDSVLTTGEVLDLIKVFFTWMQFKFPVFLVSFPVLKKLNYVLLLQMKAVNFTTLEESPVDKL